MLNRKIILLMMIVMMVPGSALGISWCAVLGFIGFAKQVTTAQKIEQKKAELAPKKYIECTALRDLCFYGKPAGTIDKETCKKAFSGWGCRWEGKPKGEFMLDVQKESDSTYYLCKLLQYRLYDKADGKPLTAAEKIEFNKMVALHHNKIKQEMAARFGTNDRAQILQKAIDEKKDLFRAWLLCQSASRTATPLNEHEKKACDKIYKKVYKFNLKTVCTHFGARYEFIDPDLQKIVHQEFQRRYQDAMNKF